MYSSSTGAIASTITRKNNPDTSPSTVQLSENSRLLPPGPAAPAIVAIAITEPALQSTTSSIKDAKSVVIDIPADIPRLPAVPVQIPGVRLNKPSVLFAKIYAAVGTIPGGAAGYGLFGLGWEMAIGAAVGAALLGYCGKKTTEGCDTREHPRRNNPS